MRSHLSSWSLPPVALALESDAVHVWRARLRPTSDKVQSLLRTLTPDECDRARRFYFQKHREQFIVARGVLRAILGRYLGLSPDQLRFRYSPHGKPALAIESASQLRFNLSHSHGLALYAITLGREVGIDVERIRRPVAREQIAERFFSAREVAALRALPNHLQAQAFFDCWTRKEAYIKARGEGLSLGLDQFDVSLVPGEPALLLRTRNDPDDASRWSLRALSPGSGYAAALAVEGHDWHLDCWQWPS